MGGVRCRPRCFLELMGRPLAIASPERAANERADFRGALGERAARLISRQPRGMAGRPRAADRRRRAAARPRRGKQEANRAVLPDRSIRQTLGARDGARQKWRSGRRAPHSAACRQHQFSSAEHRRGDADRRELRARYRPPIWRAFSRSLRSARTPRRAEARPTSCPCCASTA